MKTLDEWNKERIEEIRKIREEANKPAMNGLACPKCGSELKDTRPSMLLMSNPPQLDVDCLRCGFRGYRIK